MVLPLRFPRFWLTLGWVFVIAALWVCLAPKDLSIGSGFNDKFMHALGYFSLMLWFAGIYSKQGYVFIALLLFVMGLAVEFLQATMQVGREADALDVVANVCGIVVALAVSWLFLGGWTQRVETWILPRE